MRAAKVLSAIDFTESGLRWKFRKPIRRRCSLPCLTRQSLTAKRRLQSLLVQAKVAVCVCSRDELTRPMLCGNKPRRTKVVQRFFALHGIDFLSGVDGRFFCFRQKAAFPDAFTDKPIFTKKSCITSKIVILQNTITNIVFQNMSIL